MKKVTFGIIWIVLLLVVLPLEGRAERELFFPHLANNAGYEIAIWVHNDNDDHGQNVEINCFTSAGEAWNLQFNIGAVTAAVPFTFTLQEGGSVKIQSLPSSSQLETGWCSAFGQVGDGDISGHAVFSFPFKETTVETTVTATSPTCGFRIFAEADKDVFGRRVGVAISNANVLQLGFPGEENEVLLSLRDGATGAVIATESGVVPTLGNKAFFLDEIFGAELPDGFVGTLEIQPQNGFVSVMSVGWIDHPDGAFSFNNAPAIPDGSVCLPGGGETVWNSLSPEARELIQTGVARLHVSEVVRNGAQRWDGGNPISVYAPAEFSRQDLVTATRFWEGMTGGKLSFHLVSSSEGADIVYTPNYWESENSSMVAGNLCAVAGPRDRQGFTITEGKAWFNLGRCQASASLVTHEMGHILGFTDHTTDGSVMDAKVASLVSSPVLDEVVGFQYAVPPGTEVPPQ